MVTLNHLLMMLKTPIVNETTQVLENEETNGAIELNDEDNSGGDEEEVKIMQIEE